MNVPADRVLPGRSGSLPPLHVPPGRRSGKGRGPGQGHRRSLDPARRAGAGRVEGHGAVSDLGAQRGSGRGTSRSSRRSSSGTCRGREVRNYPALVDRGRAVDLALLESPAAAEAATRAGVRRLLTLAAQATLSAVTPRLPAAFARPNGAAPSREETEAFRALVLQRIVDDAFRLGEGARLPRTKAAFDALLGEGTHRVDALHRRIAQAVTRASSELDGTLAALRSADEAPGRPRRHRRDPRAARAALPGGPPGLGASRSSRALSSLPSGRADAPGTRDRRSTQGRREARARSCRCGRPSSPSRRVHGTGRAREALRWAFEELRVAVFAPELKTPEPTSMARLKAAVAELL